MMSHRELVLCTLYAYSLSKYGSLPGRSGDSVTRMDNLIAVFVYTQKALQEYRSDCKVQSYIDHLCTQKRDILIMTKQAPGRTVGCSCVHCTLAWAELRER